MRVYLAALIYNDFVEGSTVWNRLDEVERKALKSVPWILDSYHYCHVDRMVKRIRESGREIFLDSGAFSSYTKGAHIDIDEYIEYVKENQDFIQFASVLDAIGDHNGTWRNQKYMESKGVQPLPCFHYGEPDEVLEYYVANYDYITIGGMVPISSSQLKVWLDQIWQKHLTNPDGTAKIKVHGFGLTSFKLMSRYPWYSVDSSSWVQLGGIGNIFFPQWGMLSVSDRAPSAVTGFIEDLGFDLERLRKSHWSRKCFNIITYNMMGEMQPEDKTFTAPQPKLF